MAELMENPFPSSLPISAAGVAPAALLGTAAPPIDSATPSDSSQKMEKTEIHLQVEAASAVRCASIVKEKGQNFTARVAIEALCTMATKSSFKLREELVRQPHVRKLCQRVKEILSTPPSTLDIETLARAAEALTKFPEEVRGNTQQTLGATAKALGTILSGNWAADTAAKVLWSLARGDVKGDTIMQHKNLVSQVVQELVRDRGRRVADLSYQGLMNLLWAVARARQHKREGDLQLVHMEDNDRLLFSYSSKRVIEEIDNIDVRLLADLVNTHHEIGFKDEPLFKAICPVIVRRQPELSEEQMAKCIKAYRRFMIPLKEAQQGFRTLAIVQKGDFIRPSEKPRHKGPKTFDKPQALYPKTQLHSRT